MDRSRASSGSSLWDEAGICCVAILCPNTSVAWTEGSFDCAG